MKGTSYEIRKGRTLHVEGTKYKGHEMEEMEMELILITDVQQCCPEDRV